MGSQDTDRETITGPSRWLANLFFDGAATKYPRLDELHNQRNPNLTGVGDTTDWELACEILRRAGLGGHFKFSDLAEMFAEALKGISNPMEWLNPVYKESDVGKKEITGATLDTEAEKTTPKPAPKTKATNDGNSSTKPKQ